MDVLIVVNPVAGGGRGLPMAEAVQRALETHGLSARIHATTGPRNGEQAAREAVAADPALRAVIAVGGDGTANEIANGLEGSTVPLAIQPLGTANVLASELHCPMEPSATAACVAKGNVRVIDCGRYNGRRFIMGTGAGLDAAIVEEVARTRGKSLGYIGWIAPIFNKVTHYTYPAFRVIIDGETACENAQYAIVGICRYSAGVFCFTPEAKLDDGLFDVCIFHDLTTIKLAMYAAASFAPGFAQTPDIIYRQGKTVAFLPIDDPDVPVQVDGDPGGRLPAHFEMEPLSLPVIVP